MLLLIKVRYHLLHKRDLKKKKKRENFFIMFSWNKFEAFFKKNNKFEVFFIYKVEITFLEINCKDLCNKLGWLFLNKDKINFQ